MVKYSIKIFARIRPTKKTIGVRITWIFIIIFIISLLKVYEIGEEKDTTPSLSFIVPRLESSGLVNNKREVFSFRLIIIWAVTRVIISHDRFNKIFNQQSKQDEVFEQVAQPVINKLVQVW